MRVKTNLLRQFRIVINTFESSRISLHLSALEVSEQKSLEVTDEKLILFLRDEDSSRSSAGSQTLESTPSNQ